MRAYLKHAAWIVCLAVLLLCGPAGAADLKFSGQYTYEGWYEHRGSLRDDLQQGSNSRAFQDGGLILDTQFKIADGLSLYTRARILEKIWGDADGATTTDTRDRLYSTSRLLRENIEFTRLYSSINALKGRFDIGYQRTTAVGTVFNNNDEDRPIFKYTYKTGPWTTYVLFQKTNENEVTMTPPNTLGSRSDNDYDQWKYFLGYAWKTGDAGLGGTYYVDKRGRSATPDAYQAFQHKLNPYVRATLGPVYVEAEANYQFGDDKDYESVTKPSTKREGWNGYVKAMYTAGPVYLGGQYAFVSGDDKATPKNETGPSSGREYKPCLILLNPDRDKWLGALGQGGTTALGNTYSSGGSTNFSLYQGFVGFKPLSKLNLSVSYSGAKLKEQGNYVDNSLGSEVDIIGTYKLYDNLEYMVGFGYLWTGDAWKGTNASITVANDWLLMHRLTLTF